MKRHFLYLTILFLVIVLALPGCNISVNKSIYIDDWETVNHGQRTVNGSIIIGSNCKVRGSCTTVNGRIKVGSNSEVRGLKTVNMGVSVGENTYVDGSVSTVNGSIKCAAGVNVDGSTATVNGSINCAAGVKINGSAATVNGSFDLQKTIIKKDLKTHNGNITLRDETIIYGDIIIRKSHSFTRRLRHLKIRIEKESVVKGDIIVKDDDLDVTVYLSGGGKVMGRIIDAEVIKQ